MSFSGRERREFAEHRLGQAGDEHGGLVPVVVELALAEPYPPQRVASTGSETGTPAPISVPVNRHRRLSGSGPV